MISAPSVTVDSASPAGASQASSSSRQHRLQRRFALATVGLPTLGFAVAVVVALTQGISKLDWVLFALTYSATGLGIEAGFHRYFSHRAFRGGRFVTYLMGVLGSMAGQGPVLFWAALHRRHHGSTDRDGDPHSPWLHGDGFMGRLRGVYHAHVGWLFRAAPEDWVRFIPDLLRDRDIVRINGLYPLWLLVGLALPALAAGLIAGPAFAWHGLLWGGLVRIFVLDHMTWAVNSLGHIFGRRPYRAKDQSGNIALLALPTFGGSWHNNHHAFPASARNDHRFYQVDLSGLFIQTLHRIGLVTEVNRPALRATHQRENLTKER
jgi:stearoyl-CoA desaturase (delta-9 desaturase)